VNYTFAFFDLRSFDFLKLTNTLNQKPEPIIDVKQLLSD